VMRKFRDENAPRWSNHYRQTYTRQFEVILELLGEKTPIRDLTRADFKDLRDVLDALPPNCNNIAALKNLPIREASARGSEMGLPGLSKATVHKTITVCRSVMGYAEAEGYIERNCVVDLFRRQPPAQIRRVQPFSSNQLTRFFCTGAVYGTSKEDFTRDGRFWVPLIALWSGMRLGEIAQLQAADIEIKSGVPIFVITPEQRVESDEMKSIKTVQSRRIVPVHPELQHMGLLNYHRSILERGFVPLFPDLRRNEYSRQYDQFVQQMAHDMTRSGSRSPNHSFRSFRHNFRDAMREAGTSDENVRRLGGWTLRSIADAYGAGPSERRLYEEVKKINYEGLDLSHLHIQGAEFLA
jgi:integrase